MPVDVTSEIGPLQTVLVHTPGPELEAVTPGNREDYLYDDIIDLEIAQKEHRQFVSVLRRFATVLQVRDLLAEVLAQPAARDFLITKTMDVVASDEIAQRLGTLPAGSDRRDADRRDPRGERSAGPGAQRGRLRPAAAAQPLLPP